MEGPGGAPCIALWVVSTLRVNRSRVEGLRGAPSIALCVVSTLRRTRHQHQAAGQRPTVGALRSRVEGLGGAPSIALWVNPYTLHDIAILIVCDVWHTKGGSGGVVCHAIVAHRYCNSVGSAGGAEQYKNF